MSRKVFLLVPIIFTSFISFGNDNQWKYAPSSVFNLVIGG